MDYGTNILLQRIVSLIKSGHAAKNDLYTSSRAAENTVRKLHQELTGKLDELANNSVDELRNIFDNQSLVIDDAIVKLTRYVETLTKGIHEDQDIERATQYIDVLDRTHVLEYNRLSFEANINLAEYLHSVNGFGNCSTENNVDFASASTSDTDSSESRRLSDEPQGSDIERNRAMENSWNSLSFGSHSTSMTSCDTLSVSDKSISYDSLTRSQSYRTTNEARPESASTDERTIKMVELQMPAETLAARYVNNFQTCKHRTPCTISDILLTSSKKIVIADHYHNAIQLFDYNFTLLDEKSFSFPIGICELSPLTIAVSLRRNGQLAIFDIGHNSLQQKMSLKVQCDFYLWQVAFKSNRLFVVCDENNVHMMDTSGTEYCVIHSGIPTEHGYLRYFDVDDSGHHIYLCESKGLRCITSSGKLLWRFTNESIPEDQRDKHGHVIEDVCYYKGTILGTHWIQSKVFQISTDGRFLGVVILDQLEHPRVMSIMGRTLVVAQFHPLMKSSKRRTVKCFELGKDFGTLERNETL